MMPPTAANAAPMRKTPWTPFCSVGKLFWIGVKTCVPMAAPALPTAAARPRTAGRQYRHCWGERLIRTVSAQWRWERLSTAEEGGDTRSHLAESIEDAVQNDEPGSKVST